MRTAFALSILLALSSPALAGPLAETARGVENKSETHSSSSSDSAPDPDPQPSDTSSYDDDCTGCSSSTVVVGGGWVGSSAGSGAAPAPFLTGPARLDLYLGGHAVVGSDRAFIGEVRASKDWIGIAASGTRYFEEVEDKQRMDSVRVDLMAFTLSGRILAMEGTELWVDGGLGTTTSSEYEPILGTAWAVRAEHQIVPQLGLRGQMRYYALEHDISAWEAWGGLRAGILSAGYRSLKFNVGPALHGPEVGLFLRF
jgi:hypothetical protein